MSRTTRTTPTVLLAAAALVLLAACAPVGDPSPDPSTAVVTVSQYRLDPGGKDPVSGESRMAPTLDYATRTLKDDRIVDRLVSNTGTVIGESTTTITPDERAGMTAAIADFLRWQARGETPPACPDAGSVTIEVAGTTTVSSTTSTCTDVREREALVDAIAAATRDVPLAGLFSTWRVEVERPDTGTASVALEQQGQGPGRTSEFMIVPAGASAAPRALPRTEEEHIAFLVPLNAVLASEPGAIECSEPLGEVRVTGADVGPDGRLVVPLCRDTPADDLAVAVEDLA